MERDGLGGKGSDEGGADGLMCTRRRQLYSKRLEVVEQSLLQQRKPDPLHHTQSISERSINEEFISI